MKNIFIALILTLVNISFSQAQDQMYNISFGAVDQYISSEVGYEDNDFASQSGHIIIREDDILFENDRGQLIQYVYFNRSNDTDFYKDPQEEIVHFNLVDVNDETHLYIFYPLKYRVCFVVKKY